MTSAVVDSSPLIHLGDVGRLELLQRLFEVVEAPVAVVDEIQAKGDEDVAARALTAAAWLKVVSTPEASAPLLAWDLGAGETSVLTRALAQPDTEAIIDDLAARRCAKAIRGARLWHSRVDSSSSSQRAPSRSGRSSQRIAERRHVAGSQIV
ncbi:MAG: hypothetical protein QM784_40590 [Polyangiaceae bacterium]